MDLICIFGYVIYFGKMIIAEMCECRGPVGVKLG